jgi:NADH dehydrogenase (ubiquinone) Fe-S protein 3
MQYFIYIFNFFPYFKYKVLLSKNHLFIYIYINNVHKVMYVLRNHLNLRFTILSDIVGADYIDKQFRFQIIYNCLSIRSNIRVFVKTWTNEIISVPSLTGLFRSSYWLEREVYDMFGIYFDNHPDLRRLLTDYGFEGHPLKKDFPLTGYLEVRYDESNKKILTESIQLVQEFRVFEFQNPWDFYNSAKLN